MIFWSESLTWAADRCLEAGSLAGIAKRPSPHGENRWLFANVRQQHDGGMGGIEATTCSRSPNDPRENQRLPPHVRVHLLVHKHQPVRAGAVCARPVPYLQSQRIQHPSSCVVVDAFNGWPSRFGVCNLFPTLSLRTYLPLISGFHKTP